MVDLEHLQPSAVGIAAGEGVEARAQHHVLAYAVGHGLRQRVLGHAAARDDEGPQVTRRQRLLTLPVAENLLRRVHADDAHRQRVVENPRLIQYLMRRPAGCDAQSGPARTILAQRLTSALLLLPNRAGRKAPAGLNRCGRREGSFWRIGPWRKHGVYAFWEGHDTAKDGRI